jgi:hypothetical protein
MLAAIRRVSSEHVRLPSLVLILAEVRVGDRLPVGVLDAERLFQLSDQQGAGKWQLLTVRSSLPPHEPALVGVNPVNRPQRRKIPQWNFHNV